MLIYGRECLNINEVNSSLLSHEKIWHNSVDCNGAALVAKGLRRMLVQVVAKESLDLSQDIMK